jgi:spore germination protein YaaH
VSTGNAAHTGHAHCGWIGADAATTGKASFAANSDFFDAIHPKWFTLNPDGSPRTIAFTDDQTVLDTAHAHHIKLIPLIDADDAARLRAVIGSSHAIATHVQQLLAIVTQHGYDGLDLDYEHLWSKSDRPGYVALVTQAAAAFHAQGKTLTLSVPAQDHDDGNNAYDYPSLQAAADVIHLMGYDYHYLGGDHLGPLAPKGWIDAVGARVQGLGAPQKYVLGLANYGVGSGWYTTGAADAVAKCGAGYPTTTEHMLTCPYGHPEAGLAPHCNTSRGAVWFEDAKSIGEKADVARAHGLGGIAYWTLGGEPPGFFDAVQAAYPSGS